MAKKFNDGQTFGEIRNILNDNADDINTAQTAADNAQTAADNAQATADQAQTAAENAQTAADNAQATANQAKTAADNAQTTADKLANGTEAGRVKGTASMTATMGTVLTTGDVLFNGGIATSALVKLQEGSNLKGQAELSANKAVATLFQLDGAYQGGWLNTVNEVQLPIYRALIHFAGGNAVAFDISVGKVWFLYNGIWKENWVVPILNAATKNTIGGVIIGDNIKVAGNGRISVDGASGETPGVVKGLYGSSQLGYIDTTWDNLYDTLSEALLRGTMLANKAALTPMCIRVHVTDDNNSENQLYNAICVAAGYSYYPQGGAAGPVAISLKGKYAPLNPADPFHDYWISKGLDYITFTDEEPLSIITVGDCGALFTWKGMTGFCISNEAGDRVYTIGGGSDCTLPVASASTLGGIKIGAGLTAAADGTTRIASSANLPGTPTSPIKSNTVESVTTYPTNLATKATLVNLFYLLRTGSGAPSSQAFPARYCFVTSSAVSSIALYVFPYTIDTAQEYTVFFIASAASVAVALRIAGSTDNQKILQLTGLTTGTYYRMDVVVTGSPSTYTMNAVISECVGV